MNDKLPYEERIGEGLEGMPLPDEDRAWDLMQQKLDEGNRRRLLPPVWLQNCAGWGLVLLLLSGAAFYFFGGEDTGQEDRAVSAAPPGSSDKAAIAKENDRPTDAGATASPGEQRQPGATPGRASTTAGTTAEVKKGNTALYEKTASSTATNEKSTTARRSGGNTLEAPHTRAKRTPNIDGQLKTSVAKSDGVRMPRKAGTQPPLPENVPLKADGQKDAVVVEHQPVDQDKKEARGSEVRSPGAAIAGAAPRTADSSLKAPVSPVQHDSVAPPRVDSAVKRRKLYVSVGVGEQQQIPLGDQRSVPYDYYGREGSLSDYIPSVYVRLHKENKWFVQAEFRYGAPQSVKDFSYSQQTAYNAFSNALTTRTVHLRKTYYHQLPLSFNYFVMPQWSVGAGAMYSRFYGAVTEEEIRSQDLSTQQETVTRKIVNIKSFNDSFLYKTQVHLLLQTDFHWKRFTVGLRYARDVQPYIKYTKPDGTIHTEKNHSLQAFLRFRIWDSK